MNRAALEFERLVAAVPGRVSAGGRLGNARYPELETRREIE